VELSFVVMQFLIY